MTILKKILDFKAMYPKEEKQCDLCKGTGIIKPRLTMSDFTAIFGLLNSLIVIWALLIFNNSKIYSLSLFFIGFAIFILFIKEYKEQRMELKL